MTRRSRTLLVLTAVTLVSLVLYMSCSFPLGPDDGESARVAFPHRVHMDEGLECTDCHTPDEESEDPGPTLLETCEICHEGIDEEKPADQHAARFYEEGLWAGPKFSQLSDELLFDHKRHIDATGDCSSCHGDIGAAETIGPEVSVSKPECLSCHESRGVPSECATCHSRIRSDVPPPSHRANWMQAHGQTLQLGTENTCTFCHNAREGQDTCESCHSIQMPKGHTNQFRRRGHGLQAALDRSACQTCHQPDFCVRCHASTEPSSHRAGFGSPRNRHCMTCHEPVSREPQCALCHASTPSHRLVPPMPSWHTIALDCRQCHGAGQELRHPDNGDDCINCHR
ncbi:MAG: cytochrome c3 family protein [Planctomycetota bacterium]